MSVYSLVCQTEVRAPIDEAFAACTDPALLPRLSPEWLELQVVSPGGLEISKGSEIAYAFNWFGVWFYFGTVITEWDPPHRFCSEQRLGPYRLLRHQFRFRREEHRTVIEEHVAYSMHFAWIGRALHWLVVRDQIRKTFAFRQRALTELLGAPGTGKG